MDRTALVEQMRSTASRIQKISDNMKNCCTKIETTMKGLNGAWDSDAERQYMENFEQLKAKFPGFYNAVQSYSKFLLDAANTYSEADSAIANAGSKLAS